MTRIGLALFAAMALSGCVERDLTITTDPPNATVEVSSVEVGTSPTSRDFTHYGDYEVVLRKPGYQTLVTHVQLNPPWYEYLGVDLVAEMMPWTVRDHRYANFRLEPLRLPSDEELIRQAQAARAANSPPAK